MSKHKNIQSIIKKGYPMQKNDKDSWTFIGNVNENALPIGYITDATKRYIKYDYDTWEKINNEKNYHRDMISNGWTYIPYKLQQNAEFQLPMGTIIDPSRHYIKQDYQAWEIISQENEDRLNPVREENLKKSQEEIKMIKTIDEYMNKLRDQKKKKAKAISKKEKEKRQKRIGELEKEIKNYKQKIQRYSRKMSRK